MQTSTLPARERPPLLPTDIDFARSLTRACTAEFLRAATWAQKDESAQTIAEKAWSRDRAAIAILNRAAVPPLSTTSTGISGLLPNVAAAFVSGLALQSAAAALINAGIRVDLTGAYAASVPYAAPGSQPLPVFISEGAPIAHSQLSFSSGTVGPPRKMAILTSLSNELAEHSTPNAEVVIRTVVTESAARALDGALLSNAAADATRPAGILAGVVGLTPSTGGGVAALAADVEALVNAITAAGGGRRIMLFMSPGKASKVPLLAPGIGSPLEIVPAPSLPAATIVAVDPGGFVTGFGSEPRIDVSRETTLHYEDTSPSQISTVGTPNTVAAPSRSLYQIDAYALRLILPVAWAVRAPGLVQTISNVTW